MEVPEDLIEEFLLRLPPADPRSLVCAALVCKPWCRLICSPRFRRRFHEFHRTPPMLGFLANTTKGPRFVSTSSLRPPGLAEYRGWQVLDARHSRVLLGGMDMNAASPKLVVWTPVTNEWRKLPSPCLRAASWNAAVLCAAVGSSDCDHLECQWGRPFLIVLVASIAAQSTMIVYSSEVNAWSEPRPLPSCYAINVAPTALAGTTLYFLIDSGKRILGYDLATGKTFVFPLPPDSIACDLVLMTTEDGGLGVAVGVAWLRTALGAPLRKGARLSLWSMETGPDGDIGWAQIKVIELEKLLPVKASSIYPTPVGFTPGLIFMNTADRLFSINLISAQVEKELDNDEICVIKVVPYKSFYTPAPGLTIKYEGSAVDASDS